MNRKRGTRSASRGTKLVETQSGLAVQEKGRAPLKETECYFKEEGMQTEPAH
jgi:hypothetical protein